MYEAMLAAGHDDWRTGTRVRVYRGPAGRACLFDEEAPPEDDRRLYDDGFYVRLLRETFAARLARGLTAEDFALLVADPAQPSLFDGNLAQARPVLTPVPDAIDALFVDEPTSKRDRARAIESRRR